MVYSHEKKSKILKNIFKDIEDGSSARQAVKKAKIASNSFWKWIDEDEDFKKQYARACAERTDKLADEILEIADESTNDIIEQDFGDGVVNTITNHEAIQRSRLRVDTRKWLLAKLNPKKYGDRVDLTSDGEKIATPTVINVQIVEPNDE